MSEISKQPQPTPRSRPARVPKSLRHLEDQRRRAEHLMKDARRGDPEALAALRGLDRFADSEDADLIEALRLKDALNLVASQGGFDAWAPFKRACERAAEMRFIKVGTGAFFHPWFAHYAQARAALDAPLQGEGDPRFLLCHGGDFFIATADFLTARGMDPADPDWAAIAFDWARPRDETAWARLSAALDKARLPSGAEGRS